MYIVTGATGNTGSVVAKTLLEKGLPVRVIVRSEEKGKAWKERGAEVAIADVNDADALTNALDGGKVLYLMNPPNEQSENMIDETEKVIKAFQTAIKNSSLEKLVVLSSVGGHLSSGTGVVYSLHLLEEAFGKSDIPVTFIRPPSFLENWNSVLETVKTDGVLPSFQQPLDKKYPQIATEDIGRIAAETMLETSEGLQVKELAGFEYSPNDVAEAFSKVLGKQITAVPVPEDQWLGILGNFCTPRNAELMAELFHGINNGDLPFETEDRIEVNVTIDDYAREALQKSSAQTAN
ncbi:MAG: NmrA family NAD(P)-binding protein [Pyrinomonadaceae bacterium]